MCAVFELGQAVMQRKAAALLGGGCPAKKKAGSPPAGLQRLNCNPSSEQ